MPNHITRRWKNVRNELGKVADEVWEKGVLNKGFHSKLLDAFGEMGVL